MTDNNGQQARGRNSADSDSSFEFWDNPIEEIDALRARFSDLNVRLMDRVRPEVLERLEIGLGEGQWPEDIQQQPPQQPEPQQHDSTGGQKPNHLKLIAAMRDATFKGLPDTISRFNHHAHNEVLFHSWVKNYALSLSNSDVVDFSDQQIADALQKYDATFGSFY